MHLFPLKSLLPLLFTGCCVGQSILPPGPVEAIVGGNVTLKTLFEKSRYAFIIWIHRVGEDQGGVAALGPPGLKVNEHYEGRALINSTYGHLTLGPLKMEDSGFYTIHIIAEDGTADSGEIELRVLTRATTSAPTSAPPERCTGYIVALVVCVAVIVLLAVYPFLYKWMENKRSRTSNGGNVELPANNSAY